MIVEDVQREFCPRTTYAHRRAACVSFISNNLSNYWLISSLVSYCSTALTETKLSLPVQNSESLSPYCEEKEIQLKWQSFLLPLKEGQGRTCIAPKCRW